MPLGLVKWRQLTNALVRLFYQELEVRGLDHLPADGPLMITANHSSALADGLVLQAATPRHLHPIARSGLFRNPFMWPMLKFIGAIPVQRRRSGTGVVDTQRNRQAFKRCYEHLDAGDALMIFPEGQSHADAKLRELKTGAARIALGHRAAGGAPLIVPAGLVFAGQERFRSRVVVEFGQPVAYDDLDPDDDSAVRELTDRIATGMRAVTVNADDWEEREFVERVSRFFKLRTSKRQRMAQRLRVQRRLLSAYNRLQYRAPRQLARMRRRLHAFERLCDCCGVRDYHLSMRIDGPTVWRFVRDVLLTVLVALPVAIWGWLNSAVPYHLTSALAPRFSRSDDQYDSAKIVIGLLLFGLFWGGQSYWVQQQFGWLAAGLYAGSLFPSALIAGYAGRRRKRIVDNIRVFFLFWRRHGLRGLLRQRRREIERDLAKLVRLSREENTSTKGPAHG